MTSERSHAEQMIYCVEMLHQTYHLYGFVCACAQIKIDCVLIPLFLHLTKMTWMSMRVQ